MLPESDNNYSVRWKEIKRQFTQRYLSEIVPGVITLEDGSKTCFIGSAAGRGGEE
jgi:hypothetical protein